MAGDVRPFGELFAEPTRNGLTRPKAVRGAGVKMVNMGELFAYPRLRNASMDRVPLSRSETQRFLLQAGDLLFARQSLVLEGAGKCSIFLGDDEPVTFESHITRARLDPGKADARFYFYYLQSPHGRAAIRSIVEQGAGASGIRGSDLGRLGVGWRPVEEQRAIARILGTLDDKIELNRRMNETLEAMARTLFKSWFVDFDPVRAKAKGRDPGLPPHLADLFPDSFEDSELGEIPKGWRVGTLGALGEIAVGGDWGEDTAFAGAVEASCLRGVDLEHLRRDGLAAAPRRWYRPTSLERRAMDDRDVLIAGSGAGPTGRSLWMCADLLQALGPCTYSNFCKRIRCSSAARAGYLDALLHDMRESGEIWEYVNGTSVPNLDATSLLTGRRVPVPPTPILDRYHGFIRPIWQERYAGQNSILAAVRDALLPRLISGELRVVSTAATRART